jgi:hypothetical protein
VFIGTLSFSNGVMGTAVLTKMNGTVVMIAPGMMVAAQGVVFIQSGVFAARKSPVPSPVTTFVVVKTSSAKSGQISVTSGTEASVLSNDR